jgi:DNA-binding winged helix-turn-helix (wHTH) protein
MLPESKDVLEFGPYRIDREQRLLAKGNDVVPLPPKVFDTLLALSRAAAGFLRRRNCSSRMAQHIR